MEKLGVGHVLEPYETHPWVFYDTEKGITCSAEVRMGPGSEDAEAEIQFLRDETDEDEDKGSGGREQIMRLRAEPNPADGLWSVKMLFVCGQDYENKTYNWEEKGCEFFQACVQAILMQELPDVEVLINIHIPSENAGGGGSGRIGRKSPKMSNANTGMKR